MNYIICNDISILYNSHTSTIQFIHKMTLVTHKHNSIILQCPTYFSPKILKHPFPLSLLWCAGVHLLWFFASHSSFFIISSLIVLFQGSLPTKLLLPLSLTYCWFFFGAFWFSLALFLYALLVLLVLSVIFMFFFFFFFSTLFFFFVLLFL